MIGRRIILRDGTLCTVACEPAFGYVPELTGPIAGFLALVRFDDGSYATRCLDGAKDAPYERPAPTTMPGPGEGR